MALWAVLGGCDILVTLWAVFGGDVTAWWPFGQCWRVSQPGDPLGLAVGGGDSLMALWALLGGCHSLVIIWAGELSQPGGPLGSAGGVTAW